LPGARTAPRGPSRPRARQRRPGPFVRREPCRQKSPLSARPVSYKAVRQAPVPERAAAPGNARRNVRVSAGPPPRARAPRAPGRICGKTAKPRRRSCASRLPDVAPAPRENPAGGVFQLRRIEPHQLGPSQRAAARIAFARQRPPLRRSSSLLGDRALGQDPPNAQRGAPGAVGRSLPGRSRPARATRAAGQPRGDRRPVVAVLRVVKSSLDIRPPRYPGHLMELAAPGTVRGSRANRETFVAAG